MAGSQNNAVCLNVSRDQDKIRVCRKFSAGCKKARPLLTGL